VKDLEREYFRRVLNVAFDGVDWLPQDTSRGRTFRIWCAPGIPWRIC